jgi:hypothetical protein
VRRWVPKGFAIRPVYTFETGGSTGVPKSRINIEDFRIDYEAFSDTLPDEFFPEGLRLAVTWPNRPAPSAARRRASGPASRRHLLHGRSRSALGHQADQDGPAEDGRAIQAARRRTGLTLLRAHDNIRCLFTTPKLLEALCEKVSLKKMGITGVFCGGTEMTPQFHRFAVEELLEGAYFAPTYGNTLMGLAVHKPRDPEDNYAIIYYPPLPRAMIEVVDPDQPDKSSSTARPGACV